MIVCPASPYSTLDVFTGSATPTFTYVATDSEQNIQLRFTSAPHASIHACSICGTAFELLDHLGGTNDEPDSSRGEYHNFARYRDDFGGRS